jgi:hypothetical protein
MHRRIVRSHFKHSVERVDGKLEVSDHLADVEDFTLAKATSAARAFRPAASS